MTDKYAEPLNDIDRYAVVGNPIAHSKSPQIHAAFAKQTNQDISYEAILAPLDGFEAKIKELIKQDYKGVNVTVPFKFEAYDLCVWPKETESVAGAVNTLTFNSGQILGYNTDGIGLINDINNICENLNIDLQGARILLLGAGGAAQGVLQPMVNANPKSVVIANRDKNKARLMTERLGISQLRTDISVLEFTELRQLFDIVINATSTGLTDTALPIPNSIFAKNCLAYDMMYGRETPFMKQAKANGAQVSDGLGMLVEQAAEAFYIWRGVRPQTAPVIAQLRKS